MLCIFRGDAFWNISYHGNKIDENLKMKKKRENNGV